MPIIIDRVRKLPTTTEGILQMALDGLNAILAYLKSLVILDYATRQVRAENAERALSFFGVAVGTTPVPLTSLAPDIINSLYSTALIAFDATSGTGRWRIDGVPPTSAAAATAGMPIASGGTVLTIVGAANIRSFSVVGEPAQTLNMSVTLFQ